MRPIVLFIFILSLLIAEAFAFAQREERVFEQYLQYLLEQEGYNLTDAIKEIQSLQQGKEEIIQSYIKTEQDIENLKKSAFLTEQSELNYYEKLYTESDFPKWEASLDDSLSDISAKDENAEEKPWFYSPRTKFGDIDKEKPTFELKPPRFRILSLREYTDDSGVPALDITLKNSGAEGDVSVAIVTKDGVLISQPFYREIHSFSGTKAISFQLMQQPEQITLLTFPVSAYPR
jgi:hypothetical protein